MDIHAHKPTANFLPQRIALRGQSLLTSPRFNKGTAFTGSEREAFGLEGRLPYRINTLDEQCARAWEQVQARTTDIAKNVFMQSLKEQNWVLYYALLSRHLRELVPIIYTPTEVRIDFCVDLCRHKLSKPLLLLLYRRMRSRVTRIYSGAARVFF
jgi:malate dehydrogenase (oxaloacetate-decarboxylating)